MIEPALRAGMVDERPCALNEQIGHFGVLQVAL